MDRLTSTVKDASWDTTKLGVALYVLGQLITALFYVRFSILSLDLLRPQALIAGIYFLALYVAFPVAVLFASRGIRRNWPVALLLVALIAGKDLAVCQLLNTDAYGVSLFATTLQIMPFVSFKWRTAWFRYPPRPAVALASLFLLIVTFATRVYGHIPAHLGGGRPIPVHVFTDQRELPANRFAITRNRPEINSSHTSYKLNLLYESPDYLYFVSTGDQQMRGFRIMRLQRDQVLRMDYITPVSFKFGG